MAQLLNTTSCGDSSREGVEHGVLFRERLGGGVNPGEMNGVTRCQNHQFPDMFRLWVTVEAPVARFRSLASHARVCADLGLRSNGRDQPRRGNRGKNRFSPAVAKPWQSTAVRRGTGVQGGGAALASPNCGFSASFSAFDASSQPLGLWGAKRGLERVGDVEMSRARVLGTCAGP